MVARSKIFLIPGITTLPKGRVIPVAFTERSTHGPLACLFLLPVPRAAAMPLKPPQAQPLLTYRPALGWLICTSCQYPGTHLLWHKSDATIFSGCRSQQPGIPAMPPVPSLDAVMPLGPKLLMPMKALVELIVFSWNSFLFSYLILL